MSFVLIIAGGTSSERAVSLRSGHSVRSALDAAGHSTEHCDPAEHDVAHMAVQAAITFPVVHGQGGEDGVLQTMLDKINVPYVGSNAAASRLCFDKAAYRDHLSKHNLPVAQGLLVDADTFWEHPLSRSSYVLKPHNGGSSIDTLIVRDYTKQNPDIVNDTFGRHQQLLLEELVEGIEITVPVLGNQALPVIEIIPPANGEFDYENKYNGATQELCPAQHVPAHIQQQAQDLAVAIHKLCNCDDYTRTDMIVRADGSLVVLETNTLPGMTDQSLFPKSAAVAGLTMSQLCDRLVALALSRQTGRA